jgi:hypothetical protein
MTQPQRGRKKRLWVQAPEGDRVLRPCFYRWGNGVKNLGRWQNCRGLFESIFGLWVYSREWIREEKGKRRRTTATSRFQPARTRCSRCCRSAAPCRSRSLGLQPTSPRTRRRPDRSPQSKVDGFCRSRYCLRSSITKRAEPAKFRRKSPSCAFNVSVIVYSPNSTRVTPNGTLVPSRESLYFRVELIDLIRLSSSAEAPD